MSQPMLKQIVIPRPKDSCSMDRVAIFGSADVNHDDPLFQEVYQVAKYLAQNGKIVVDGGGPGLMLAATEGAKSVGGKVVTVTFQPQNMPEFEGQDKTNISDLEIKTTNYVERMFGLMDEADTFICFKGGTGTLSEWSTAWLLSHLNYGNHKPIILYGQFWHEVLAVINKNFFIGDKEKAVYKVVVNQEELIQALGEFEQDLAERCSLPVRV
ncbi:LOG family protein [Patescibacteria group bacterium]|nr:LOG family protein [Patescibacteria group bacterium]